MRKRGRKKEIILKIKLNKNKNKTLINTMTIG